MKIEHVYSSTIRTEAADLLACLASQPKRWRWETMTIPGGWSRGARNLARRKVAPLAPAQPRRWRDMYAEAEARLRSRP